MARRGIIGRLPGNFGDEPLARVVDPGADFFTARIDEVQFDSRYPVLSPMLSDEVTVAARTGIATVTYPANIAAMPFIPLVLCGIKSNAGDGRLLVQGRYLSQSQGFTANFDENFRGIKNENDEVDTRHLIYNQNGTIQSFETVYPDVSMPYLDIDEIAKDGQNLARRGMYVFGFSDRAVFYNTYGDPGTVVYHVMNIGV